MDDVLMNSDYVDSLVNIIGEFFDFCVEYSLKIHPAKCTLYSTSVKWCGRIISANGIRLAPHRIYWIGDTEVPTTGSELQ